jgi:hypothetical protein
MTMPKSRSVACALVGVCCGLASGNAIAGPPYMTDDPEPVEPTHWEVYLASQHAITKEGATGTAPHFDINYGALPNLHLHALIPLAYALPAAGKAHYGVGDIELGGKLRFVQEKGATPMVAFYPAIDFPTGNESKGLGTGSVHVFLPVWFQKTWAPWSTLWGGGYWINPGKGNRDYFYVGSQLQRRLSELVTVGGELFYTTPDHQGGSANVQFNVGVVWDLSKQHHLMASAGRSLVGDTLFACFLADQITL